MFTPSKSSTSETLARKPVELPDFAGLFANHGVAFFAAEGFGERVHVGERSISAEARERMRIGVGLQARSFGALIRSPDLRPAEEETLLRGEAVDFFARLPFQRFFVGGVGDGETAEIADAFAQHQLAILMQAGLDFVGVKLFCDAGGALVEIFAIVARSTSCADCR